MDYRVNDKQLNASDFLSFVNQIWPGSYDAERTQSALAKTLNITAYDGTKLVGCLRILSDGYFFGTITELLVLPEYQNKGVGSQLLQLAKANTPTMLYFGSQPGVEGFYEKNGCKKGMQSYTIEKKRSQDRMLEKMGDFFEARLKGYEEHQLTNIESAREFYPFTARCLPQAADACILDLGCGTGLELGYYFETVPTAKVTGIDLAPGMLEALRQKFPDKRLTLIAGSYFDVPLEEGAFDAAVSVESLHHFTQAEKIPLYEKVHAALKPGGFLILTDYFAASEEEERSRRAECLRLKREQGIQDDELYHYDTPLTVDHEREALLSAGFSTVAVLKSWGPTSTLKAIR